MTDISQTLSTHTEDAVARPAQDTALVRGWLWSIAFLILLMILVGGATRLTDSGLSITEWKPIHGVIPPLSVEEWEEELEKYRQIPEYQLINKGMSLDEFKVIFWWEWGHRLLGRVIGFAVFIPLVIFMARKQISPWLMPRVIALLLLGGLQGFVGWWMVASGLTERTDVSQYRLATHLTLACILLAYTVWLARRISPKRSVADAAPALRLQSKLLVLFILIQIALGALVAGLDAGLAYNTWPLMDGALIPSNLFPMDPWWLSFFESAKTVQFDHRMAAYALVLFVIWHAWCVYRSSDGVAQWQVGLLLATLTLQVALGVLTLLHHVPITLALAHQEVAALLLCLAVIHAEHFTKPLRLHRSAVVPVTAT